MLLFVSTFRSAEYFLEELLNGVIFKTLAEKIVEPDFVNNLLLIFLDEETVSQVFCNCFEKTFCEFWGAFVNILYQEKKSQ